MSVPTFNHDKKLMLFFFFYYSISKILYFYKKMRNPEMAGTKKFRRLLHQGYLYAMISMEGRERKREKWGDERENGGILIKLFDFYVMGDNLGREYGCKYMVCNRRCEGILYRMSWWSYKEYWDFRFLGFFLFFFLLTHIFV